MDFAALKAELVARGFDSLSSTRQGYYINAARAELDRAFLWSWRESSATGTSPLAISDLVPSAIEKVVDTSNSTVPLTKVDWSLLVDLYGDLSTTGTALYYYVATPAGTSEVATYPSADTISVQYWRRTPDLVNASDVPASPDECHYTIVDLAVRRAYRDNDDHEAAAALQPEIDNAISQFLQHYGAGVADGPDGYVAVDLSSASDW